MADPVNVHTSTVRTCLHLSNSLSRERAATGPPKQPFCPWVADLPLATHHWSLALILHRTNQNSKCGMSITQDQYSKPTCYWLSDQPRLFFQVFTADPQAVRLDSSATHTLFWPQHRHQQRPSPTTPYKSTASPLTLPHPIFRWYTAKFEQYQLKHKSVDLLCLLLHVHIFIISIFFKPQRLVFRQRRSKELSYVDDEWMHRAAQCFPFWMIWVPSYRKVHSWLCCENKWCSQRS